MKEIRWKTIRKNVDIETGEQLTDEQAKKYQLQKTKKKSHVKRTTGIIELTNEYRKGERYQGELFSGGTTNGE